MEQLEQHSAALEDDSGSVAGFRGLEDDAQPEILTVPAGAGGDVGDRQRNEGAGRGKGRLGRLRARERSAEEEEPESENCALHDALRQIVRMKEINSCHAAA